MAQELLSRGADVNCQMVDGASPAFIAAQNGHFRMLKFLVANKANINLARKVGQCLVFSHFHFFVFFPALLIIIHLSVSCVMFLTKTF